MLPAPGRAPGGWRQAIRVHKRGFADESPSPDWADALALAVEARKKVDHREMGKGFAGIFLP